MILIMKWFLKSVSEAVKNRRRTLVLADIVFWEANILDTRNLFFQDSIKIQFSLSSSYLLPKHPKGLLDRLNLSNIFRVWKKLLSSSLRANYIFIYENWFLYTLPFMKCLSYFPDSIRFQSAIWSTLCLKWFSLLLIIAGAMVPWTDIKLYFSWKLGMESLTGT